MKKTDTITSAEKSKARLGLHECEVNMGLFDFSVLFIVGDYAKVGEYVARKYEDKDFDPSKWDRGYIPRGKCFYRTGYVPIIWLPKFPRTAREQATLAHECLHAIFNLFEWAGLKINQETEEVMTHSLAHLIVEFNKAQRIN